MQHFSRHLFENADNLLLFQDVFISGLKLIFLLVAVYQIYFLSVLCVSGSHIFSRYIHSNKKNTTPLYGYTNKRYLICLKKLKYIISLLKVFFFDLGSLTLVCITHICMLHCQTELTQASTDLVTCGHLASMRNISVRVEVMFFVMPMDFQCIIHHWSSLSWFIYLVYNCKYC